MLCSHKQVLLIQNNSSVCERTEASVCELAFVANGTSYDYEKTDFCVDESESGLCWRDDPHSAFKTSW